MSEYREALQNLFDAVDSITLVPVQWNKVRDAYLSAKALLARGEPEPKKVDIADVKLKVLRVSFGIQSIPELELFHRLEEFYCDGVAAGAEHAITLRKENDALRELCDKLRFDVEPAAAPLPARCDRRVK